MNELDQNNINKGEEHGEAGDNIQNQGGNINNHVEISDNEGSYNNPENNNNNSNDNQQYNYDSSGNSDNEPNVNNSEDDNDRDMNDIGHGENNVTIRRRHHNINT